MQNFLVTSAIGSNKPGLVDSYSRTVKECGCSIVDSRMTVLGGEFAMILLLSGSWDSIAKLEAALPRLEQQLGLHITSRRTASDTSRQSFMPYAVEVVAMDHPGIVHEIAHFFSNREINIVELNTGSYAAAHTGSPMFSLHMTISIPSELSIAALRGDFMDFCDHLNLDAILEPVK